MTWREKNRARVNAWRRAWRKSNPVKERASCQRYAQSHRAETVARVRRWQLRQDPAAFRALQARYRANALARRKTARLPASTAALLR